MPVLQAKVWLQEHDAAEIGRRLSMPTTIAELYAIAAGQLDPRSAPATGMYL
jgi:hypothetical protein